MAISYTTAIVDGALIVTAHGFDERLSDVQEYGAAILRACIEGGVTRVLCDERELEYRLSTIDTFDAATFIAAQTPARGRVAIVCRPEHAADAAFWETVAVNRGIIVQIFHDRDRAEAWLRAV